jgi:hypothetical protein
MRDKSLNENSVLIVLLFIKMIWSSYKSNFFFSCVRLIESDEMIMLNIFISDR